MFSKFNEDAQKVLLMAKKEMLELKHPYVGSEHLLLSILNNSNFEVTSFLNDCGVTYDKYKKEIINIIGVGKEVNYWFLYTPLLKRVIENAILDSKDDDKEVTVEKLFLSLLEEGDGVANRILMGMNIDIDALYDKFSNKFVYKNRGRKSKLLVEEYAVDFNQMARNNEFDPVIGRDDQINRIIEILLRRTKNNPLLIGEAGVGKTAIVEELARKIENGLVPSSLKNKRILSVSIASLVAGTKYRGEFEERINKLIEEVEHASDIILFVDEIHTIVGAGGAEGAIDASNILKPYLARGKIRLIGATTRAEYSKFLENDKALDRRFQKVFIEEPSISETENILFNLKEIYENFHGIRIKDEIIKDIVLLSDRYINSGKQPDKALDVLDEACTKALMTDSIHDKKIKSLTFNITRLREEKNKAIISHDFKKASDLRDEELLMETSLNKLEFKSSKNSLKKEITKDILYDIIYNKTKIPVKSIINLDAKKISKQLKRDIIGQDRAIDKITSMCLKTINSNRNSPYSFLLIGRSGVGKTFLIKEYAKLLYAKDAFIKIDMSEYRDSTSLNKIIGSAPGYVGYSDKNTVLEKVKNNPHSVILLDEIEKAHSSVLKLFLQVLDDGYMTSSDGEKISFKNSVIFMTSNLGCSNNSIGFLDKKNNLVLDKVKSFLGVELVNRLDDIILFDDISDGSIEKIIKQKLLLFAKNNDMDSKAILKYAKEIKEKSQYKEFGARRVDKVIEVKFKDMAHVL